jgi:predicted component of viral defense system (DUF524 family)
MIEIFTDKNLQNAVDDATLFENITYYIKLKAHNPVAIEKETASGLCADFIDWHPSNPVGQITFRDVAGFVNLFGTTLNVKSTKLLTDLPGINQIEYLLKDISDYSSTLVFLPAAAASFHYDIDPKKLTGNNFYIYKYLSSRLFHDRKDSLQFLFEFILDSPHFNQRATPAYTSTFATKKFNHSTFQRIAERIMDSDLIPPGHELCKKPFISRLPTTDSGDKLLPRNLYSVTNTISYDTPENRFLKYFLLWCQEIYLNVYKSYPQYQIREDCSKSLKIIRKYLLHPFFRDISNFSFLPTNSSVLANRVGYKEIFLHYLKCRSQPKMFDGYMSDMFDTMGIKSISTLYEYWTFFNVAKELYGEGAVLEVVGHEYENNNLKYNLKISKDSSTLYYNKTYRRSLTGSYNFSLRPDISLEINKDGETRRYFFDAKYSNTPLPSNEDEAAAVYKNTNVVKMLSYLEAIHNADFAIIVYPGTKFSFYSRHFTAGNNYVGDPSQMVDYEGVGALPLSPNHVNSNEQFSIFMECFKNHFLKTNG